MIREQMAKELWNIWSETDDDLNEYREIADGLIGILCAEIEKMGLSDDEIRQATRITQTAIATPEGYSLSAQAQLQKILNKLKEGAE